MAIKILTSFFCREAGYEADGRSLWAKSIGYPTFASDHYPISNLPLQLIVMGEADVSEVGTTHRIHLQIQNADGKLERETSTELRISMQNRRFTFYVPLPLTIPTPGSRQLVIKIDEKGSGVILPLEFVKN